MADHTREVRLWLDNTESDYREAVALAEEALQQACDNESHAPSARSDAVDALSTDLRTMVSAGMPDLPGMWGSLLSSLLNDIDFDELAEHYLDDLLIWSVFSSDAEEAELFTDLDLARECLLEKLPPQISDTLERRIQDLDDGGQVDIEGVTYQLSRNVG
jgi:hypothetical protein